MKKFKTLDLFAGCGGLTEGLEKTGFYETVGFVEWDKPSFLTLKNRLVSKWNYKSIEDLAYYFDMQRTEELFGGWNDRKYGSNSGLRNHINKKFKKIDLIVGGPPCQAYSLAGRIRDKNGMTDDYRNYLFETYIKTVQEFKPKVIVFENVLGLLSAKPGGVKVVDLIQKAFKEIGYVVANDFRDTVVDASDYGVPQNRKRTIIIGLNQNIFGSESVKILDHFYSHLLPKYKLPKMTVSEALSGLPKMKIVNGKKWSHEIVGTKNILNHIPRYHSPRDISIFIELANDIQRKNPKFNTIEALKMLYKEATGNESNVHKYHVLKPNEQSNTIVSHLYKDGLRHIHPDPNQGRSITVREAARLQSFDDDFEFLGSMGDNYKMIGNAVPPLLAYAIGMAVSDLIKISK